MRTRERVTVQLLVLAIVSCVIPAFAQTTIGGVCENESYQCSDLTAYTWLSMYGTNLPDSSSTVVGIAYSCDDSSSGDLCGSYFEDGGTDQTYWYNSTTQINFYMLVPSSPTPYWGGPPTYLWGFGVCTAYGSGNCTEDLTSYTVAS